MSKVYEFDVMTTIRGKIRMTLEDNESAEDIADQLENDTVSYEDMELHGSVSQVDTECDDWQEVKNEQKAN